MSNKTEIKVYLPTKMVGELEQQKKAGLRSKFIKDAIRFKLDGEAEYDISDCPIEEIFDHAVWKMRGLTEDSRNQALVLFIQRVLK